MANAGEQNTRRLKTRGITVSKRLKKKSKGSRKSVGRKEKQSNE